jgi:peptidoglycan/xylan/chitin deacetylase (PgdA/CDA1 family)
MSSRRDDDHGRHRFHLAAQTMVFPDNDPSTVGGARALQVSQGLGADDAVDPSVETVNLKGESADPDPVKPGDADAADSSETKASGGKVIYLTFDDGPAVSYTKRILDLLDEYDAKATFFELGENAKAHPQLTRSVVARGHALGSHTWNHKDLRNLRPKNLNRQITRTSAELTKIGGRPITCLRPPYGAVNARVRSAVHRKDLSMELWDIDPRDWRRPGAAAIARRVVSHAHKNAVSLMHDGGGNRSQSVRALKRILQKLSKKGYRFETLPGC